MHSPHRLLEEMQHSHTHPQTVGGDTTLTCTHSQTVGGDTAVTCTHCRKEAHDRPS